MAYIDAYFSFEKSDKTVPWPTKDEGVLSLQTQKPAIYQTPFPDLI